MSVAVSGNFVNESNAAAALEVGRRWTGCSSCLPAYLFACLFAGLMCVLVQQLAVNGLVDGRSRVGGQLSLLLL